MLQVLVLLSEIAPGEPDSLASPALECVPCKQAATHGSDIMTIGRDEPGQSKLVLQLKALSTSICNKQHTK